MIFSSSFMEPDVAKKQKQKQSHSDVDNKLVPFAGGGGGGDGSSIEVAKRPRGRPPGSKNRPKPPVIITRESDPASAMRPHVLEIAAGCDVVDSLSAFSRRRSLGVCVLAATGAVANVTLRQPPHPSAAAPPPPTGTVGFRGRFEVLSMSAAFFPPDMLPAPAVAVTVSLAGPGGQVVGGTVVGPLVAAGTVTVVAAAFENPTFLRLPVAEEEEDVSVSAGGGEVSAEGYGHREFHRQHQRRDHDDDVAAAAVSAQKESSGMAAMYSSAHFPAEPIWAPTGRPPHPPPPYL